MDKRIGSYIILYLIGEGSSAHVFAGIHEVLRLPVAIKRMAKDFVNLNREIEIMMLFDHKRVISLFEIIEDNEYIYLVMELAENGNLLSVLNLTNRVCGKEKNNDEKTKKIFRQIVEAVDYLHNEANIAHRDLKLENILFDQCNNVKIADFGFSIKANNESMIKTACGSPLYVAPEVILRKPYSKSADIWSLGVMLYFMITGFFPFEDHSLMLLMRKIVEVPVDVPDDLDENLRDLLTAMLSKDPSQRPTIEDIKFHPWVADGSVDSQALYGSHSANDVSMIEENIKNKMNVFGIKTENARVNLLDFKDPNAAAYRILRCNIINREINVNDCGKLGIARSQITVKHDFITNSPSFLKNCAICGTQTRLIPTRNRRGMIMKPKAAAPLQIL